MRILHVYKDYPPVIGGIEHHVRDLAEAQAAGGHDVSVLCTRPGHGPTIEAVEHGVRVVRAHRLATIASTPLSLDLVRRLRTAAPDITHLQSPYPMGELAWLAAGRRPLVVSYQSDIVRQRLLGALWAPGLRLVLARADRVIASSPPYVASSPFLRRVRGKVAVVPIGIDVARFAQGDRAAGRARFGERPTVVFVGRLRYYKGLPVLLESLRLLPGVQLVVVGTGPGMRALAERSLDLGVADRVKWVGDATEEDLLDVLAAGDVFVLPSTHRSEAYGIALVEAMAAGLPAVTTELGTGTSWINQDGHTGRVVAPGDAAALAAALREILGDDARRAAMAAAARARAQSVFSRDAMVAAVMDVYAAAAAAAARHAGDAA
ncbi:glycosyl transferase family 1 [bacterium]|nr:glycosyltransferase [Chloroflexi bacterium CFX6]RIL12664.1 MAG: glycosyl transferase family 1 [bacterium]